MPTTALSALPYPALTSPNNPPADFQALANALDPKVTPQIAGYGVLWSQSGGTTLSIGNGGLDGWYVKIGRLVLYRILLTRGSTTNLGTASYQFALPVAADSFQTPAGTAVMSVGGSPNAGIVRLVNSTTIGVIRIDDSLLGPSSFSWASGDTIMIGGSYMAGS